MSDATPHSGQRVGEYVLDAVVGRGAFGEVWRAKHHAWTDQIVAVKIPTDLAYAQQLQREGFAAPRLIHPNIVRALAFDGFATPPYLAMEYVPGENLRTRIARGPLEPALATTILRQVLAALGHAHAQGVVHRDVKPENILLRDSAARDDFGAPGRVMLTDFGLGQSSRAGSANSIAMSMSIASPDAQKLVGTLDYMSPESRQVGSGELDGRTDLYACGIMLFEMLTGERPAGAEVPSDLKPALPKRFDEVFRKAYARRESRFASAEKFAEALVGNTRPPPLPAASGMSACPRCRGLVTRGDQFCIHCGTQVAAHIRRCSACGAYPSPDDQFCIHCGSGLPATREFVA